MSITAPEAEGEAAMPEMDLDQSWWEVALCAETDPEVFFPENGGSTAEAKRVCARCEVRAQCLAYALRNDERVGVWGGLSVQERHRVRRGLPGKSLTRAQIRRQERDDVIVAMTGRGINVPSIAAKLGIADQTVYRALARHRAQAGEKPGTAA